MSLHFLWMIFREICPDFLFVLVYFVLSSHLLYSETCLISSELTFVDHIFHILITFFVSVPLCRGLWEES